jgi:hypothetical protein
MKWGQREWVCADARFAGLMAIFISILGLAPQALFCHLLRRFRHKKLNVTCFAG